MLIIPILLNVSCSSIHYVRNTYISIFYYYFVIVDNLLSALFKYNTYPFTITESLSLRDADILYQMFIITIYHTTSLLPLCYHTIIMEEKRNNFIDNVRLSESTSFTHLLDGDDDTDNTGLDFKKHSPYYSEHDYLNIRFGKGKLGIMSLNCQSINTKFEEFRLFIDRIN